MTLIENHCGVGGARSGGCMTASGVMFYPLEPRLEDIKLDDIAHGLAATNRFNGHTKWPYSVAQHSVLVSQEMQWCSNSVRLGIFGLLHDASEAYLCDLPRPIKRLPTCADYRDAESRLQGLIYVRFGLWNDSRNKDEPELLKIMDRRMLRTEQSALMPPAAPNENRDDVPVFAHIAINRLTFESARALFLDRASQLGLTS